MNYGWWDLCAWQSVKLSTHSFTHTEVAALANLLTAKFGLITSLHASANPNQFSIYIGKPSMATLIGIVEPHILPSFKYKLGL